MKNDSGKWLMLHKDGKTVVEGESNPDAASVLAAPGGDVPQDLVDRHGLADKLKADARPLSDHPATGAEKAPKAGVTINKDEAAPVAHTPAPAPREGAGLSTAPAAGKPVAGQADAPRAKG